MNKFLLISLTCIGLFFATTSNARFYSDIGCDDCFATNYYCPGECNCNFACIQPFCDFQDKIVYYQSVEGGKTKLALGADYSNCCGCAYGNY